MRQTAKHNIICFEAEWQYNEQPKENRFNLSTAPMLNCIKERYRTQLPSTRGTRPDPQAPIDKTTHAPKRYFRLDNFIRSMVYQSLKADQSTQQPAD